MAVARAAVASKCDQASWGSRQAVPRALAASRQVQAMLAQRMGTGISSWHPLCSSDALVYTLKCLISRGNMPLTGWTFTAMDKTDYIT